MDISNVHALAVAHVPSLWLTTLLSSRAGWHHDAQFWAHDSKLMTGWLGFVSILQSI